jgi:hypothetical protein
MKPPICALCGCRLAPEDERGGLVTFRLTAEQEAFNRRFEQPGFTGHPQGTHWFCGEHRPLARELAHHTAAEALHLMRTQAGLQPL